MRKHERQNRIIFINAIKGSGKTILAHGLAYAQSKKVIWITPSVASYYPHKLDLVDSDVISLNTKEYLFLNLDIAGFDEKLWELSHIIEKYFKEQGVFLVIDELDTFAAARINHKSALYHIINLGRHYQIDLCVMARRIQDIPKTLLTNADYFISGRNHLLKNDVNYLQDFFKESELESLSYLPNGTFLVLNRFQHKIRKVNINKKNFDKISAQFKNLC